MSEQDPRIESGGIGEAFAASLVAMLKALVTLLMFAATLLARALQAVFILARPALLAGSAAIAALAVGLPVIADGGPLAGEVWLLVAEAEASIKRIAPERGEPCGTPNTDDSRGKSG
jgi:hypothetical protein